MSQTEVQLIKDAVIVNADISNSAAIDVSKISGAMPLTGGTFTNDVTFDGATAGRDILFDRSNNHLKFKDNAKISLGTDDDANLYFDGTNPILYAGTNTLRIVADNIHLEAGDFGDEFLRCNHDGSVDLYHDNSKKFNTTSTGATVTGDLLATGLFKNDTAGEGLHNTATGAKFFSNNSNDTHLEHGSNAQVKLSFIASSSTYRGAVSADASAMHLLTGASGEQIAVRCVADGTTELRHSGSKKFETLSSGVKITGLNATGSSVLGDFRFKDQDDNLDVHYDAENNKIQFLDNNKATFGTGDDLTIHHSGTTSFILNNTGNLILSNMDPDDDNDIILRARQNESSIVCKNDGAVELYHNGSQAARTITTTGSGEGLLVGDDTYINTSVAHGELIVRKDLNSPANPSVTQCARITIITNERTAGVNGYGGALFFGGQDVDTSDQYSTSIAAIAGTCNGNDIGNATPPGFIDFYTRNGSTFGHRFRITNTGDLQGTDTTIGSLSDSRLKENIEDFTFDINKFKQFQPKLFNWKHPEQHRDTPTSGKHRGFIAQDLEVIDSELVSTYRIPKDNPEGALVDQITLETEEYKEVVAEGKTANLGRIDAMYISVINQLIAKVEALETKVAALEAA